MIILAFDSGMVFSETCLSKHCCQQIPSVQSKVTQMMDELIKEIHSTCSHRIEINRYRIEKMHGQNRWINKQNIIRSEL